MFDFKKLENLVEGAVHTVESLGLDKFKAEDLFTPEFLQKYTNFKNLQDMIQKSGFKGSAENLLHDLIQNPKWGEFIKEHTKFGNWQEMVQKAIAEFTSKK
ncbi:MAG TPA: hypothetical protein VHY08_01480 [Bacillota bacterium]|nr:hypothetical protein [Bacillota bacterium]